MLTSILLVGEDGNLKTFVSRISNPGAYQVVEATDAQKAIAFLADKRFDLILVDDSMPHDSGWAGQLEFVKENHAARNPIVITSPKTVKHMASQPTVWETFSKNVSSVVRLSSITRLKGGQQATGETLPEW
jgi:CheY-like chemotaxis protein